MQSPIIKKILTFGILSSAISLLLACLSFGVVEFYKIKNETIVKVKSQMDILAYNLQPTLLFDDKDAANNTLHFLNNDESIKKVTLYKANGKVFAQFIRSAGEGNIKLDKEIIYENKSVGRLEVESIYLGIHDKYFTYFLISLLIMIISIPASNMISKPIRKQLSMGVIQLEGQSDRLRLLADQVVTTEQRERKRIAAIIHDHLQQLLVAGKLKLGLAMREMNKNEYEKAVVSLQRVDEFINEATRAAKTLTVELRPPVLYEDGLAAAFHWLANKFQNDHNLKISLHLDEIPEALSDTLKIMIFESVKELLFNVVKYAEVQEAELWLTYHPGVLTVIVKDIGRGFDLKHMERADSSKGFGLFSIRERLKLINGTMNISSEPHQGTKVEIKIELQVNTIFSEGPIVQDMTKSRLHDPLDKRLNIMVVDDHKIVREGISNLLNENPSLNVIAHAQDGVEALEKAEIYEPDIIVMDINMPRLNGIEATRAIKSKFPKIEIIGLSVQEEANILDSMIKAGAATLLNKAGDPQELVRVIMAYHSKL